MLNYSIFTSVAMMIRGKKEFVYLFVCFFRSWWKLMHNHCVGNQGLLQEQNQ